MRASGSEAWTARYDRPLKDIFAVQDEIVGKVVTTLGLLFKLDEMKTPTRCILAATENLEAFDDFLRAIGIRSGASRKTTMQKRGSG